MPDPIAPAHTPAPGLATTAIALDPGWVVRPSAYPDPADHPAVLHWRNLLVTGRITNRNPPAAPHITANRDATAALFRAIATDRRRLATEARR